MSNVFYCSACLHCLQLIIISWARLLNCGVFSKVNSKQLSFSRAVSKRNSYKYRLQLCCPCEEKVAICSKHHRSNPLFSLSVCFGHSFSSSPANLSCWFAPCRFDLLCEVLTLCLERRFTDDVSEQHNQLTAIWCNVIRLVWTFQPVCQISIIGNAGITHGGFYSSNVVLQQN